MIGEKADGINQNMNCETLDSQPNEDLTPSAKEKGNEVGFQNNLSILFLCIIIRSTITKNMRRLLKIGLEHIGHVVIFCQKMFIPKCQIKIEKLEF